MHTNARLISSLMLSTALISTATPALAVDALETPTGGNVVAGSASINSPGAGQLVINQNSDRTVIDWNSFNIGEKASTEFVQPGSTSLAVNRVTGAGDNPTQILGSLRANGRVMVLDRNGVVFGKNARIDVGGIVASTGDVNTAQVMSGSERIELTQNGSTGAVENKGTITVAEGGLAALVAPTVRNSGTINARLGRVGLASGDKVTVDLYGDNLIEMEVAGTAKQALVENAGVINAEAGLIQISTSTAKDVVDNVINLDGVANVSSVSQQGGRIVLSGGTVNVKGTANASGRRGGSVRVDADKLNMAATAQVKADANAGEAAGRVELVASDSAVFDGTISAVGEKGTGFVDTSAANVDFGNNLRVTATDEWLIDPTNITIGNVLELALELQLNFFGNATLETPNFGLQQGNITVNETVNWTTNNSLTLTAHNNIVFNAGGGFVNTGAGNILLTAGNNVLVAGNGIRTNGGDVNINSRRFRLSASEINARGGDITINNTGGFDALANSLKTSGTGTITLNQNKDSNSFLSSNSIQNAVDAISNSGTGTNTVNVGAGSWTSATLDVANLVLNGANAGVDGTGARATESIVTGATGLNVTANNVTIDGFRLNGNAYGVVSNAANTKVRNNLFTSAVTDAVVLTGATNASVTSNLISGAGRYGVNMSNVANSTVDGNTITGTGNSAVFAKNSTGLNVTGNIINKTGNNAIYATDTNAVEISQNYIGYSDAGVTSAGVQNIKGDGILLEYSHNTADRLSYIRGNTITQTKSLAWDNGSGIEVKGSYYVRVGGSLPGEANTVSNTGWDSIRMLSVANGTVEGNILSNAARTGIYIGSSNNVTAKANTFSGAGSHFGIHVDNSSNTTLLNNELANTAQDGIFFEKNTGTNRAQGNTIRNTGDDGIAATTTSNLTVAGNDIYNTADNGIEVNGTTGTTRVVNNEVRRTGNDGIYANGVNNLSITGNDVGAGEGGTINGDGIFVTNSDNNAESRSYIRANRIQNTNSPAFNRGSGIQVTNSDWIEIGGIESGNFIENTGWDAIRLENVSNIDASGNWGSDLTRTGIYVGYSSRVTLADNTIDGTGTHFGVHGENSSDLTLSGLEISNTAQDGIYLQGVSGTNMVEDSTVTNAGDDGIAAENTSDLTLAGNTVNNAASSGIHVYGSTYNTTVVAGNTINDAPVGMTFESGLIDMTGDTNTINGGDIGLRFIGSGSEVVEEPVEEPAREARVFASLIKVGGPGVDLKDNTIGTTVFNGQGTYYVELLNGALFAPGTPTLEDGLSATYDGLTPALTAGVLTLEQQTALEDMFWHFNDDATVGLFFFGSAPLPPSTLTFDDADAYNTFAAFAPAAGRVGLTITGMPRIPGAPQPAAAPVAPNDLTNPDVLNTLSPAAGGEPQTSEPDSTDQATAEQVAAIAPAAGGQSASCWSDAANMASSGQPVNYNFSTDGVSALNDAAACGSSAP